MKIHQKYQNNINWEDLSQIDLIHKDQPIFLKNFLPSPDKLLSWEDIENLVNIFNLPFKFIDKNNPSQVINPEEYKGIYQKFFQNKETIRNLINNGFTFFSKEYSFTKKLAASICSEIDSIFRVTSEAQIFGSKSYNSISFPIHLDDNPIFVFQTYGKIKWVIYDNKVTNLMDRETVNSKLDPNQLINPKIYTLEPGDFLYIPQRTFHQILLNEPRLTISINCFSEELANKLDREYYEIKN